MHGYFEVVLLPKLGLGLSRVAEFEAIKFACVERDAVTLERLWSWRRMECSTVLRS